MGGALLAEAYCGGGEAFVVLRRSVWMAKPVREPENDKRCFHKRQLKYLNIYPFGLRRHALLRTAKAMATR